MAVHIDEARRHNESCRVDDLLRSGLAQISNLDDRIALNANVGSPRWTTGAIHEFSAANDKIQRLQPGRLACDNAD